MPPGHLALYVRHQRGTMFYMDDLLTYFLTCRLLIEINSDDRQLTMYPVNVLFVTQLIQKNNPSIVLKLRFYKCNGDLQISSD